MAFDNAQEWLLDHMWDIFGVELICLGAAMMCRGIWVLG